MIEDCILLKISLDCNDIHYHLLEIRRKHATESAGRFT